MKRLIGAFSIAAILVAVLVGPAGAAAPRAVATINGGGTSLMEDGAGTSVFGVGVKLFDGGRASGHFMCLDQVGSRPGYPGIIWGEVTGWSADDDGIVTLTVIGKFHPIPGGHPGPVSFTVKIQAFGGAGVGHWTLEIGGQVFCIEILTSGQIVMRPA